MTQTVYGFLDSVKFYNQKLTGDVGPYLPINISYRRNLTSFRPLFKTNFFLISSIFTRGHDRLVYKEKLFMHLLNFSRDVSQNYILRGVNWFRADTKIEN